MRRVFLSSLGVLMLLMLVSFTMLSSCGGRIEVDTRPVFHIDSAQPFYVAFGRGNGLHGLETVELFQDGECVLHRRGMEGEGWETRTCQLDTLAIKKILTSIDRHGLMEMHRGYYDIHTVDGSQWIFWVKQGKNVKSIYFDNRFPEPIVRFANDLDSMLVEAVAVGGEWRPISEKEVRAQNAPIWDGVR